jgi:hypothetical protein
MTISESFLLALEAYQDLQPELKAAGRGSEPMPEIPTLHTVLSAHRSIPPDNLILGIAEDKLPILLDVNDPAPGPILVIGDGGSGKTTFLQFLACSLDLIHDPGDIQFAAITNFPDEWKRVETLPTSKGVWPAYHPSARLLLAGLCSGVEGPHPGRQTLLLFLDDLELLVNSELNVQKYLHWLLTYGPRHRIWPVVTVNSIRALKIKGWLEHFSLRVYGRINSPALVQELCADPNVDISGLFVGLQFKLQMPGTWLDFMIPGI